MRIIIKDKSKIEQTLVNLKIFKIKISIKKYPKRMMCFLMELTIFLIMLPKIKESIQ